MRIVRSRSLFLLAGLALFATGCEKLVQVNLNVVEPCDQRDLAVNNIQSFRVSADIDGTEEAASFTKQEGAQPLRIALGTETAITLAGWAGDAGGNPNLFNTPPDSIARTNPLTFSDTELEKDILMVMGRRDSMGQTTDSEGACQTMDNGLAVPGRHGHTATYIPGADKVLIVGGAVWQDDNTAPGARVETILRTAELWDPQTGVFQQLPELPNPRAYHTATAVEVDGQWFVVVAGGFSLIGGNLDTLSNGFVFDPRKAEEGSEESPYRNIVFRQQRAMHTATYLTEQNLVVLVGGCTGPGCTSQGAQDAGAGDPTALLTSVEVYDPVNDSSVPGEPLTEGRALHAASALRGRVLVSGGVSSTGPRCTVEVFQVNGNTVTNIALDGNFATLPECPVRHAQVSLPGSGVDRVAIIGGQTTAPGGVPEGVGSGRVVFWNTTAGVEANESTLITGRAGHRAAILDDGSVFVYGGEIANGGATAERLALQADGSHAATTLELPPRAATAEAAITRMPSNQVFVSGGFSTNQISSGDAYVYFGE